MTVGKLTEEMIAGATLQAGAKMLTLSDGHGLTLRITAGERRWVQRWRDGKREGMRTLGFYPAMTLAQAREAAPARRSSAAIAPVPAAPLPPVQTVPQAVAQAVGRAPTFGEVGAHWLEYDDRESPKTLYKHKLYFGYLAAFHGRPITGITRAEVRAAILAQQDSRGIPTADRVGLVALNVFTHGETHFDTGHNPAVGYRKWLRSHTEKHRAGITDPDQFGLLMEQIDLWEAPYGMGTSAALRFMARTVMRREAVCGARWDEMKDLDKPALARWEIPAGRMKGRMSKRLPHVVPLAPQAVAILTEIRGARPESPYCFPHRDRDGSPMDAGNLARTLAGLSWTAASHTPHGFRTSFTTFANEAGKDSDVIELCMAHIEANKVRAAYNRAERMDERRALMNWWADEIERLKTSYKVAA